MFYCLESAMYDMCAIYFNLYYFSFLSIYVCCMFKLEFLGFKHVEWNEKEKEKEGKED